MNRKARDHRLLGAQFHWHKRKWLEETMFYSDPERITGNAHYQAIIRMGWDAVPLILEDMQRDPKWWFEALYQITDADPITEDMAGHLPSLTQAWLKWGREHGYLKT